MAEPLTDATALETSLREAVKGLAVDIDQARFGIAVSGGPDSMALLHVSACAFPGRVEAATVDHGLRPESADEAAMVARWCAAQGIAHAILHPVAPRTGNLHDWGRAQRYTLLEAWRVERKLDWLFTAHHADDQLETMLMRLNRGAGIGGLAGVRPQMGHVLRPLLGVRKSVLQALVDTEGLPHVQDPSNADPRFDRSLMRSALADANWLDPLAAARSAAALGEAEEALGWTVDSLADRHLRREGNGWRLEKSDFPHELQRRLLLRMLAQAAPDASPPRGDSVDRAIAAAMTGQKASLGDWLLIGGAEWILIPAPPRR
ncbi:tRNA lysidine(34) synthetase TilS [Sphingobium baderi]|uniref:tRNA(Ile)-lysidine synthase n=1 Tax=Sphingobium baderi TaxID=1332080 RepID=A0A0S3EWU7_9SPHN|nr:tRNA lysidine(34) synthetase TilS [Sphingobium baderi]ALR19894.1 tRNA(Ile)-lysidine synthetase [Sphingobium baderi]